METKSFKFEKGIVNVHFDCLPGKESLEKSCSLFMSKVLQAKEKADVAASTNDKLNR